MESKVKEVVYTRSYGLEKGYLKNKKIFLRPVPKGGKMITDPNHTGYFMWEGASKMFCLMKNKYNELINPFQDEDEQAFFSAVLDLDLNVHKRGKDNFWNSFYVTIKKDYELMNKGMIFDLADPTDNLRVRVLKQQEEVGPSWDKRYDSIHYKFALVEDDYEEKVDTQEMDMMEDIWTHWGTIKSSTKKMREFLQLYWMHKKSDRQIPEDSTREFLTSNIKKLIEADSVTIYKILSDDKMSTKLFILKGMKVGAIIKEGVGTYYITGDDTKYQFTEFIQHIDFLKESTDPIYRKIEAQINTQKA